MARTTFQFLWRNRKIDPQFRTAVSLHSHTSCSEEGLAHIAGCLDRVPFLKGCLRAKDRFDFSEGYWAPPLSPRQAYRLEEKQIHRVLQMPALVSLTDHDDIRAGTLLRLIERFSQSPISVEWSVPFRQATFHIGVHNLPASSADDIFAELRNFTLDPKEGALADILDHLNSYPDVLLVLNHPFWDETGHDAIEHCVALRGLLDQYGRWLHALEVNGLRGWEENQKTIQLGSEWDLPVVSGGDRHGLEPNATLNVSQAATFAEFVHEIRYEHTSHIVLMPQYREPQALRMLRMIADVLGDYPRNPAHANWQDRIFVRDRQTGLLVSIASAAREAGGLPSHLRFLVEAVRLCQSGGLRWAGYLGSSIYTLFSFR